MQQMSIGKPSLRQIDRGDPGSSRFLWQKEVGTMRIQRQVVDVRYMGDYKLWLQFDDGRNGVIDLADDLWGEEHESLRDRDTFSNVYVDSGLATIAWWNGAEFTPEYLYHKLNQIH
jgi:hypothetical protein